MGCILENVLQCLCIFYNIQKLHTELAIFLIYFNLFIVGIISYNYLKRVSCSSVNMRIEHNLFHTNFQLHNRSFGKMRAEHKFTIVQSIIAFYCWSIFFQYIFIYGLCRYIWKACNMRALRVNCYRFSIIFSSNI